MKNKIKIAITSGHKAGVATEIISQIINEKALKAMFDIKVISLEDDPTGIKALDSATEALKAKEIDAVVTAPISKAEASAAGFQHIGHTEFFTENFAVEGRQPIMLLVSGSLRVALVTKHTAIKDVANEITTKGILNHLRSLSRSLVVDFEINAPKIAVLGLNPHCGDNGLIGKEDNEIITPAIDAAQSEGLNAFGPYAADGFFGSGAYAKFDAVLAMYHDQGLAPFKTLAFDGGVNYTAGLPIVRTSPGHGVGLDIAGKGIASADSMRAAIYLAADIVRSRRRYAKISANPLQKQRNDSYENRKGAHRDVNVDELFSEGGELK